jgi:FkbM family methyltransferase
MSRHADAVVAFEPFEPVRRRLLERIASNGVQNVTVWPLALSANETVSFYFPPQSSNQGTGSLIEDMSSDNGSAPIEVKTDAGDKYFAEPTDPKISILKIDVEGSERDVLEGLRESLMRCRPAIVMELSEYTRARIGGIAELRSLLYPDAIVLNIEALAGRFIYRLRNCDFQAPSDILILPPELFFALPKSGTFAPAIQSTVTKKCLSHNSDKA